MILRVWSKSDCGACHALKRYLAKRGIPFTVEMVDASNRDYLAQRGYTTLPIIEVLDGGTVVASTCGFRPEVVDEWTHTYGL